MITSNHSAPLFRRWSTVLLAALILLVLAMQTRSLFVFPQPDGARWWGDETGQMVELKTELTDGFARIPIGIGSSVAITNGIVRGNSWMAAAIYGIPVLLFSNFADVVSIGRVVTFLLALLLCFTMSRMLRAFGVSSSFALLAVLLLVTSRSFFFASHAARLDIAAGLSVLGFVRYLGKQHERMIRGEWTPTAHWYFTYGVVAMLFATLSIHLLSLIGVLSIYMLFQFGAIRKPLFAVSALFGVASVVAILLAIYGLSGVPWTLFGVSAKPNQFQSVANMLPIQRPFSRSVQIANILERWNGLRSEAPAFLLWCGISFSLCLWSIWQKLKLIPHHFLFGATIAILFAWLFFQSPALYYYLHVLPLFIVVATIAIASRIKNSTMVEVALLSVGVLLSYFAVQDTIRAGTTAMTITRDNGVAMQQAALAIQEDAAGRRPIVLAQNPAIAFFEHSKDIRLMSAHIVSFPLTTRPLAVSLDSLDVNYIILYAPGTGTSYSEDYATPRPVADSLGTVLLRVPGRLLDVDLNYFASEVLTSRPMDTLILYKLPTSAR